MSEDKINEIKKIGMLTGGGDSSGINDFIRTTVVLLEKMGMKVRGIKNGYRGLIEGDFIDLNSRIVDGIKNTGGTYIGTSRTNPYKVEGAIQKISKNIKDEELDLLLCVGGNDTLGVANRLYEEEGIKIIGVPQTIDNDLLETDYSIGFHSAVENIVNCVNMVMSSAMSHEREMFVEVMGRDSGFLGLNSAIVLGADYLLIPEFPADIDKLSEFIVRKRKAGKKHGLYIISEGVQIQGGRHILDEVDDFGHKKLGGISYYISEVVEKKINIKPNVVVLGYTQRGGKPCPYDSYISNIFAKGVVEDIKEGIFGFMVAVVNEKPKNVRIADAVREVRLVSKEDYEFALKIGDVYE